MMDRKSVEEYLSQFQVLKCAAVYESSWQGLRLPPFKGSTFRGAFGQIFRQVACVCAKDEQGNVRVHDVECIYRYFFETTAPQEAERWSQYESIPRPFLFDVPNHEQQFFAPGERFPLQISIFGQGIRYWQYLLYVLDAMGKQGFAKGKQPAELKQVFTVDVAGNWRGPLLHEGKLQQENMHVVDGSSILQNAKSIELIQQVAQKKRLVIHFTSPVRIKQEKKLTLEPEFHLILRNAVRRITALLHFHQEVASPDWDFRSFFEEARAVRLVESKVKWMDWERYSSKQQERLRMGGFMGYAVYEGDLLAYLPWLLIGEWANIGKNPVFGLGKIRLGLV